MAAKKSGGVQTSEPVRVQIQTVDLVLRGTAPLVVHAFAEKAKQEIRDKQAKKAKQAKAQRKPEEEFLAARYVDAQGRECVPVTCLKKCIITAATAFDDLTKVALRQALFVMPTPELELNIFKDSFLVPIEHPVEGARREWAVGKMREDAVTIGINTRGLTYRPEYNNWMLRVSVEFNPRLVSKEQLLALVDQAGWGVGIAEGRPERSSALGWGRFERVVQEEQGKEQVA